MTSTSDDMHGEACGPACGYCGRCTAGRRPNAVCPDCGRPFVKGHDDVGDLCDRCADQAWAVERERRWRRAAARVLPTRG